MKTTGEKRRNWAAASLAQPQYRQRVVTTPFRVEDYLDTPARVAAYLDALAEDEVQQPDSSQEPPRQMEG